MVLTRTVHSVWLDLSLGLTGILLQYSSFHPLDLGFLAWISLVPWLLLSIRSCSAVSSWILFLSCFFLSFTQLRWMTVADYRMIATWLLLSWWCSLFPWLGLKLVRFNFQNSRIPITLSVPVIWVSFEYAKSFLLTGFPWYFLAHTQHSVEPLLQSADLSSTQGLSFAIGMFNGFVVDLVLFFLKPVQQSKRHVNLLIFNGIALLFLMCGLWTYGIWRITTTHCESGPRVALLQGNHAQAVRNNEEHFQKTWQDYKSMLLKAKSLNVNLIVWPETSFPFELPVRLNTPGPLLGRNDEQDLWSGPPQLLGVNVAVMDGQEVLCRHNSSMLQDFQNGVVMRYDKIHRVPFGEYIPFKDWIPVMNWLSPYDFDYSIRAGTESTSFSLSSEGRIFTFNSLLCYEDSDFSLTRWAMNSKRPPDFWVNQSNDGWFQGTEEHAQHLAIARFRCVETRRSMVRAVNTGISAIIDPCGRILLPQKIEEGIFEAMDSAHPFDSSEWSAFKNSSMILLGNVRLCHNSAPYVFLGDWVAWFCLILIFIEIARYILRAKTT